MNRIPMRILAVFFLIWGLLWLGVIYQRSMIITYDPVLVSSGDVPVEQEERGPNGRRLIRFRSPHVKDHHLFLFRLLIHAEVVAAFLLICCAYALVRGRICCKKFLAGTVIYEAVFRLAVASYLFFYAIPLARLIQNGRNLVLDYFLPDDSVFSGMSAALSGLSMYHPKLRLYFWGYLAYIIVVLFYAFRPDCGGGTAEKDMTSC